MTRSAGIAKAKHLDESELVDWLDGTLAAARRHHVHECERCRIAAEDLSRMVHTAHADDVPEPSPLFWDQLSDRVRLAVANEPSPRPAFWQLLTMPPVQAAGAAAAIVILASVLVWRTNLGSPSVPTDRTSLTTAAMIDDVTGDDAADDLEQDEAWALVRAMADDLEADDLDNEGVGGQVGSADHLALRLTERERVEFARLLEEQTRKLGKAS